MTHEQIERLLATLERIADGLEEVDRTLGRLEVVALTESIAPGSLEQQNAYRLELLLRWFTPLVKESTRPVLEEALRAKLDVY